MLEYLKRRLSRLHKIEIETYPKYYEENGMIIREEKNGTRYVVNVDKDGKETIVRGYNG